ncbi:MAG: hypothetical protein Q9191_005788 [Dirinaria sp. TL-2023a]
MDTISASKSGTVQQTIDILRMQKHPEGGYFVETDRDPRRMPNPFSDSQTGGDETRNFSTTIFYLLTPDTSKGSFHRNKGRTVHTLHRGRGVYVIIHADEVEQGKKARVETFVVGHDLAKGEKMQWIVEGGKYKASFLLPDLENGTESDGLLISETVVPGFEFSDHNFMPAEALDELVESAEADGLRWLLLEK